MNVKEFIPESQELLSLSTLISYKSRNMKLIIKLQKIIKNGMIWEKIFYKK